MRAGSHRSLSVWLTAVAVAGTSLLCLVLLLMSQALPERTGRYTGQCDDEEKAAFREVQHLAQTEVSNFEGNCRAVYRTPKSPDEVKSHYTRQLEARGWTVLPEEPPPDGGKWTSNTIVAFRGDLRYSLGYEDLSVYYENPMEGMEEIPEAYANGTHLVLEVFRAEQ